MFSNTMHPPTSKPLKGVGHTEMNKTKGLNVEAKLCEWLAAVPAPVEGAARPSSSGYLYLTLPSLT